MPGVKNGHKTSPETAEAKMRAAKALELRMEGKTFAAIAKEAGYNSPQAAHDAVKRALDATLREPADRLRALELERLDVLWQIQYLNAQAGDVQAMGACMKIMERRGKLLGLDAAVKAEVTGADGQPLAVAPPVLNIVIDGDRKDAAPAPQAG